MPERHGYAALDTDFGLNCTGAYGDMEGLPCHDVNGRLVYFCPRPGPQYPEYADAIVRDDCGNLTGMMEEDRPFVTYNNPPSPNFLPPRTGPYQSWTNAMCELNMGCPWNNADANRDYMYYAASWVGYPGEDAECVLSLNETIRKNVRNYDWMYDFAAEICAKADAEYNVSSVTLRQIDEYADTLSDWEWDRYQMAIHCSYGANPAADMAWCVHAYKPLGDGRFCHPRGRFAGTRWEGTPEEKQWECPEA